MIKIDIEDTNIEIRNKRGGGTYSVQAAYAHTHDRNGQPNRYPERFNIFPPRDEKGNAIPYQPGTYVIAPQSLRINNGFLELAFPQLIPANAEPTSITRTSKKTA